MRFIETAIAGAFIVALEGQEDERGSFARCFCEDEFRDAGIAMRITQVNLSTNRNARTLRGMHYQAYPNAEPKLIQCLRGRAYDVALDLRPNSTSFKRSVGIELTPDTGRLFYIPPGCAHGFLTLDDNIDILYFMGAAYVPGAARGVRWNDPQFKIAWPAEPQMISARDRNYPDFYR